MTNTRTAVLHGFFRSSASWRVRIALELKGIRFEQRSYKLRAGEQRGQAFLALNPQGLVPALEIDGLVLTQSLAICEYLDETRQGPSLVGDTPAQRAQVRALAQLIACDVHPIQNLKILNKLKVMGHDDSQTDKWAVDIIAEGFEAFDRMLTDHAGSFCCSDRPTLADLCLIPQLANARRFGLSTQWPRLLEIERHCLGLPAFRDTAPDKQPDFHA